MRGLFSNFAFVLLLAGAWLQGHEAAAETFRLGGTGGAMPMAQHIATAYAAAGGPTIEIVPDLGSSGAIRAIGDGVIDLAISSRPLKPEETARGLTAVPLARTAMVLVTSRRQPGGLKSADLPGIFAANDPKWENGSPIRIILRPRTETDTELFIRHFPGMAEALEAARQRPEVPVASTDQDNAKMAEELVGSLTPTGLSQIVVEKRNLRLVPIDGVEPTLENFEKGTYPYDKPYYLVYSEKSAATAQALLDFLRSGEGQGVLREVGCLLAGE
ncbi:MAG: substrate-binding domain-containing protein [Rhizobium sp.]